MAVRVHACQRCGGTLVTSLDGWTCLACARSVPESKPVEHAAYHVGRCAVCGHEGYVYRRYVGDLLLWVCSRDDGILGRRARREVVDKLARNPYTNSEGTLHSPDVGGTLVIVDSTHTG